MAATPLDVARSYIARGWNPVPVRHRTKKPIGDEWQLRIINDANVAAHFNATPQNIGVILGTSSHGRALALQDRPCRQGRGRDAAIP